MRGAALVVATAILWGGFALPGPAVAATAQRHRPAPAAAPQAPPFVVAVHAASGPTLSYFAITTVAGKTTRAGVLVLYNRAAQAVRVTIDPVDAVTASTLGSAYQLRGLPIHGATHWLRLAARRLTLPAHSARSITVNLGIPAGARPGDYLSGVAIQASVPPSRVRIRSNVGISSVSRYAVGVEVSLPGPRHPRIALTGASVERQPSAITFLMSGRNTGNVILKNVTGSILITQGRRTVARVPILPGTFVTNTSIAYPVPARGENPPQGTVYRMRAVMRYAGGVATLDRSVVFGAGQAKLQREFTGARSPSAGGGTPWAAILIPALAALAAIVGAGTVVRRRRGVVHGDASIALERALAGATPSTPVSVFAVAGGGASVGALLRRRTRPSDKLVRRPGGGFAIVAPETGAATAAGLAADLRSALARETDAAPSVGAATAEGPQAAAELLARADADARAKSDS
jgi:hypothetical protein